MNVLGWAMLIPYFTAYLIHYFYNLKTISATEKKDFRIGLNTPKKHIAIKKKKCFFYIYMYKK